ncbi:MAG: methyltransferase [Treponema sp.]|jgi:uroporphyrinogen-III decarboxylase|nr:methyltransferase [Treponema sp.]
MTGRERIRSALEHRNPDKVPVDFGASAVTGINASVVYQLRRAFNLPEHPVRIVDCYQMLGEVEEDLREKIFCDCVQVLPYNNLFGFRNNGWKEWNLFDGTPVLVPGDFNTVAEKNGGFYQYPQGDRSAGPSGYMPKGGYYFDAVIRQEAFDEDNPSVKDNMEEFVRLSDEELRYNQEQAELLRKNTECAVIASVGGTALGDIAMVPATFLKHPKGIRDVEEWYVAMAIHQDFLKELYDQQTQQAVENLKLYREAVGDNVDVIYLCGADFGSQNGPMCSVELFNDVYLPYYRRMTDWIHRNTSWKVFKHCCGSIKSLIPSIIDAGIDILNPVQNSAASMDAADLKKEFGHRITFWGGGVDTQKTLPFGKPEQVYEQVTERIRIYYKDGGFVFSTIHNTQARVPVENFIAMTDAIKEFR